MDPSLLNDAELIELLNILYEKCPPLTNFLLPRLRSLEPQPHSVPDLLQFCDNELMQLVLPYIPNTPREKIEPGERSLLCDIVAAHPRLGVPKNITGESLSEHSNSEQQSLQGGDPKLAEKLLKLNYQYEEQFPGLRFVVFVNGRSREIIMEIMRERIARNNWILEVHDAIKDMSDIAIDRWHKMN
ncbi:hypothetical protein DAMA08_033530 [Martiniozyma asiatica (nom. inval.)]|nr:hypothetical protein DAMA08_033530 [Martiniozyma asiatica]